MSIDDLWYKNAVIYCLDVEKYQDANEDGIGVTVHNFSSAKRTVRAKIGCARDGLLVEVFDGRHSKVRNDGTHHIELDGHAWRWFRVGGADNVLDRSDLDLTNPMR